jgi:SOS-response transcriptional repressor LexA
MLTPRMRSVLLTIQQNADQGLSVSRRELAEQVRCRSTSDVSRIVNQLVERGWIVRGSRIKGGIVPLLVVNRAPERRQFFRFDQETKQLVQFTPVSGPVSEEPTPETQKGPRFPAAP